MPKTTDSSSIMIVTCPGGSNVSLLAYNAVARLQKEGYGKHVKLIGERDKEKDLRHLSEVKEQAGQWVLIEGCPKGCGGKVLESAGIVPDKHLLVSDLGIERENKIDYTKEELELVIKGIKSILD